LNSEMSALESLPEDFPSQQLAATSAGKGTFLGQG
jgi:hypothetical protein